MKTIIKTSIKGNENVTVKETVQQVYEILIDKRSFALLTRISTVSNTSPVIIRKSSIKMVKTQ